MVESSHMSHSVSHEQSDGNKSNLWFLLSFCKLTNPPDPSLCVRESVILLLWKIRELQ